jgi:hypothetical protein
MIFSILSFCFEKFINGLDESFYYYNSLVQSPQSVFSKFRYCDQNCRIKSVPNRKSIDSKIFAKIIFVWTIKVVSLLVEQILIKKEYILPVLLYLLIFTTPRYRDLPGIRNNLLPLTSWELHNIPSLTSKKRTPFVGIIYLKYNDKNSSLQTDSIFPIKLADTQASSYEHFSLKTVVQSEVGHS